MKLNFPILLTLPLLFPLLRPGNVEGTSAPVFPASTSPADSPLPLSSSERDHLALAEQASMHELLDIRGGDVSNENLMTILLVLGIVVLVLLLL